MLPFASSIGALARLAAGDAIVAAHHVRDSGVGLVAGAGMRTGGTGVVKTLAHAMGVATTHLDVVDGDGRSDQRMDSSQQDRRQWGNCCGLVGALKTSSVGGKLAAALFTFEGEEAFEIGKDLVGEGFGAPLVDSLLVGQSTGRLWLTGTGRLFSS
jgi:hypothetical protein